MQRRLHLFEGGGNGKFDNNDDDLSASQLTEGDAESYDRVMEVLQRLTEMRTVKARDADGNATDDNDADAGNPRRSIADLVDAMLSDGALDDDYATDEDEARMPPGPLSGDWTCNMDPSPDNGALTVAQTRRIRGDASFTVTPLPPRRRGRRRVRRRFEGAAVWITGA